MNNSTRAIAFALGVAAAASSAIASDGIVGVHGRIFTDVYAPTEEISQKSLNYVGTTIWLQADPRIDENTSARLILEANLVETNASQSTTDNLTPQMSLREAYATYSKGAWDLRIGRQIIPWGKSDGINPTDFLGAKDYSRFNPDEEVRRIGATSMKVSFTPKNGASPLTFTGVWQPVFPRSKFLISPESIPSGVTLGSDQTPSRNLSNSEFALRTTYYTPGWDFSLMGFHGWNHLPEYQFGETLSATSLRLDPTFHQIRAVGADYSQNFGDDWVARLEGAYTWTENDQGLNPTLQPSHADGVVGLEKAFGENFRAQLQGIVRYHPRYTSPSEATGSTASETQLNQSIAALNAVLMGYQVRTRTGVTARLAYTSEKTGWAAETFGLVYITTRDFLIRPKITRDFTDTLKASVGVDYYGGKADKQLGTLRHYNSVFFEGKYTF